MSEDILKPQTTVGQYAIKRVLGRGAFGITYLASHLQEQTTVAIKEFFPAGFAVRGEDGSTVNTSENSGDASIDYQSGLDKFLEESRVLSSFNSHHIVRVVDTFELNATAYMVMQYEEGGTLSRYLAAHDQPLSEDQLMSIFVPVLKGLKDIHASWLLHRDIKPENIYIRKDGTPLLIDFGTARHALSVKQGGMTEYLTPGFAPPEQYDRLDDHGPWTDIYAVGATMYYCVTRIKPAEGRRRTGKTDPVMPAVHAAPSFYDKGLLELIDWMMTPDLKLRPQTVDRVLKRIEGLQANNKKAVLSDSPPIPDTGERTELIAAEEMKLAAEQKAQEEADRVATEKVKAAADLKAKQEADRVAAEKAKAAADLKAKQEADRVATEKAKVAADLKAKQEADRVATEKAKAAADLKAKQEADRIAAEEAKAAADLKAKQEVDRNELLETVNQPSAKYKNIEQPNKKNPIVDALAQPGVGTKFSEFEHRQNRLNRIAIGVIALVIILVGGYQVLQQPEQNAGKITESIDTVVKNLIPSIHEETTFWSEINCTENKEVSLYLEQYPNGTYKSEALSCLKQIKSELEKTKSVKQLTKCKTHLAANRLTTGEGGNALDCYEKVLTTNPGNPEALDGIKKIGDIYVRWVNQEIELGNLENAKGFIEKLKQLNSNDERIVELEDRLLSLKNQLEKPQATDIEKLFWVEVNCNDKLEILAYLDVYPGGLYSSQADACLKNIIKNLERKEPSKVSSSIEALFWESTNCDVRNEVLSFLEQYPAGDYSAHAEACLKNIEKKLNYSSIESIFWDSTDCNDKLDMLVYLDEYPGGLYSSQAEACLKNIE